ncbi:hypothetical protein ACIBCA_25500 [Kitasatospora sp. NPDC051170]|uniref:hypothetical protein n=1 Tax=Kitasatospora sp. NPDC051170 TaxID=3364056 RepID=UPI0037A5317A
MGRDVVRESARAGRLVVWEESARDGAQAKTLMPAAVRVRLAREQGRVFGADGPRHVVFAAGFPAVCAEEFEAVRRVAVEAEGAVSVAAVCRGRAADVRQAVAAVRRAEHARVMVVVPASEAMASTMAHRTAREALEAAVALIGEARAVDDRVAVDLCLADASRADHGLMAAAAGAFTGAGAGVVVLADTVGLQLPSDTAEMFAEVAAGAGPGTVLASHLHNDLGLGLANTLEALRAGVRVAATSWLGIAERSGMAATEQLLLLLAEDGARAARLLGPDADRLWWTAPDLTALPRLAGLVSEATGVPLGVTTPVVGTGVGSISTGTPFVHPRLFQPYDPQAVLGTAPRVVLTQLASARVVRAIASRLGHDLEHDPDGERTAAALAWVKSRAFRTGRAVVEDAAFAAFLDGAPDADLGTVDADGARTALGEGAAVLPNPAPLTFVVAGTDPRAVNTAKGRPADQAVALWAHDPGVLAELDTVLGLGAGLAALARRLLTEELVTLLLPLRPDADPPAWLAPATRDGWTLLFGARWSPLLPVLAGHPVLYVSSANRTGRAPAATAAEAEALGVPVLGPGSLPGTGVGGAAARAATTTLRLHPDGRLDLHRAGAQDRAYGGGAGYLEHLRAVYGPGPGPGLLRGGGEEEVA